ncbi:hypothetical protein SDRG_04359 [Saprolegnia diclina VS20]|uniref:Uncharacterized protein n=1 Tax=Saprolegnia diclina (strain VS20) TaxID=1156394 RepID=T0S127_SAPDV|nr:hypothetical protein SDRG_04359 [Saprolegnia diclina VS20]EQC38663.1 hypothetical protein SDRG_04359 [Saprolegnia diclina VS20]|eukprot:XP_008608255.1 hypothetical protein SDRG_04359 [Saprolegnia diclina VS20]
MAFLFRLLGDLIATRDEPKAPSLAKHQAKKKSHQYQQPVSRPHIESASYATDYFDAIVELSNHDAAFDRSSSISDVMDYNDPLTPSPMPSALFSKQYYIPSDDDDNNNTATDDDIVVSNHKWNSLSKPDAFLDQILIASTQAVNYSVSSQTKSEIAREILQQIVAPSSGDDAPRSLPRLHSVSPQVSVEASAEGLKKTNVKSRRRSSKWLFEYQETSQMDLNSFQHQLDERLSSSMEQDEAPLLFEPPPRSSQKSISTRNHALTIAKEMSSRNHSSKLQRPTSDDKPTLMPVSTQRLLFQRQTSPPVEPTALPMRYTRSVPQQTDAAPPVSRLRSKRDVVKPPTVSMGALQSAAVETKYGRQPSHVPSQRDTAPHLRRQLGEMTPRRQSPQETASRPTTPLRQYSTAEAMPMTPRRQLSRELSREPTTPRRQASLEARTPTTPRRLQYTERTMATTPRHQSHYDLPVRRPSFGEPTPSRRPSFGEPTPTRQPSYKEPSRRPSFGESDRRPSFGEPTPSQRRPQPVSQVSRLSYDGYEHVPSQPPSQVRRTSLGHSFIEVDGAPRPVARRMDSSEREARYGRNEYLSLRPQIASKLPLEPQYGRRPKSHSSDVRIHRPTFFESSSEDEPTDMLSQFQAIRNRTDPAIQARLGLNARLSEAVQRIPTERLPSTRPKTPKSRKKVRFIE